METSHKRHEILDRISSLVDVLRSDVLDVQNTQGDARDHPWTDQSELVSALHRLHIIRECEFRPGLFEDTGWHLLLEVFKAEIEHRRAHVSALCVASKRAQTTALRFVADLEEAGLVARRPDPEDRRRTIVTLTDKARDAMKRIHEQMSSGGRIGG